MALLLGLTACGSTLWPEEEAAQSENTNSPSNLAIQAPVQPVALPQSQPSNTHNDNIDAHKLAEKTALQPILSLYFTAPNIAYQQSLFQVVEAVINQQQNANFILLLASPDDAKAELTRSAIYGQRVLQSLLDMGIQRDKITLIQSDMRVRAHQIQVFVKL